jgi:hypothetical protein
MSHEEIGHDRNALTSGDVGQPNHSGIWLTLDMDELTEVRVEGHEHTIVTVRQRQERCVTGIETQVSRLHDIVPLLLQPLRNLMTGAPIDQEPQLPAIRTASSESLAMTAWA